MKCIEIINKLYTQKSASREELIFLLNNLNEAYTKYLLKKSNDVRKQNYGDVVYLRGIIEFTNHCKRNCLYCGIRRDNKSTDRYRLTKEEILECATLGNKLGYKTFVLQGGEDPYFTDEKMIDIIKLLKERFPQNAITLSLGERSYESYKSMYEAGADRYLLRHETASKELYEALHPDGNFENRIKCLKDLKEIGYQVGAGFLVGLPDSNVYDMVENLLFIKELEPAMCGIGPFIPQKDTSLSKEKQGTVEETIIYLALIRLLVPDILLPSTTALGTIDPLGREKGLKAGANVVMPNLSPVSVREKYALYDGKICTGDEAAECRNCIERKIVNAGFRVEITAGHNVTWAKNNNIKNSTITLKL